MASVPSSSFGICNDDADDASLNFLPPQKRKSSSQNFNQFPKPQKFFRSWKVCTSNFLFAPAAAGEKAVLQTNNGMAVLLPGS